MASKKDGVVAGQVGLDEVTDEFRVPLVVRGRKAKESTSTSVLDLSSRPQTWLKLLSLEVYLPVWFGKISNVEDEAYYLDFFAGPGVYQHGVAAAKGSPVLACEAAADIVAWHAARGRRWTPHLRFVEPGSEARTTLTAELARFGGVIDYRILPMTAGEAIGALLAESSSKPTLAFFDPFGYAIDLRWVEAFARDGINEVLVSFDAQGILRNVAAGQTAGVTEFSGGEWWRDHVHHGDLDLPAYLRALATRLRHTFRYSGIQEFEFLSNHARRAVAQCCGSVRGREAWLAAVRKARGGMTLVDDFFPELDKHALVNAILERIRGAAGRTEIRKGLVARLDDLDWTPEALNQALAFLADEGIVAWSDHVAAGGYRYRLYRFSSRWRAPLVWDGVTRAVPAPPGPSAVSSGS